MAGRLLDVFSHGGRGKGALWEIFYKEVLPPHDLIRSQRAHLLVTSHWRLGLAYVDLGGTQNIQSLTISIYDISRGLQSARVLGLLSRAVLGNSDSPT